VIGPTTITPSAPPSLPLDERQPVNRKLSEDVAREVRAKTKTCWENAALGLVFSPQESPLRRAAYVEGIAYTHTSPGGFSHGWLELDGQIIDPTLCAASTIRKIRLPDKNLARTIRANALRDLEAGLYGQYHAHRRYTYREVYARVIRGRERLPLTPDEESFHHVEMEEKTL
jgi:hypothetical protein